MIEESGTSHETTRGRPGGDNLRIFLCPRNRCLRLEVFGVELKRGGWCTAEF